MLSYRKSQQVSLTEKLKKKNVIHAFGVSGSGTTMARLCHSAFARVATRADNPKILPILNFATAHSRGLRLLFTSKSYISVDFASAHSRGLRPRHLKTDTKYIFFASAHLRGLRLVRASFVSCVAVFASAHSRGLRQVRGNCHRTRPQLCHSAFVRVATRYNGRFTDIRALCHSAFVRVATPMKKSVHMRGFSLPQRIRAGCDCGKAMQRTANLLREGR